MYPTLAAEIARRGMNKTALARKIGMRTSTLCSKLNGRGILHLKDAQDIKKALGTEMPLEKLFEEAAGGEGYVALDDYDEKQQSGLLEE